MVFQKSLLSFYKFWVGVSSGVRIFERSNHVRSPDPIFASDLRIKKCSKSTILCRKYFYIITRRDKIAFLRTSDFADENTTIGDNCLGVFSFENI